MMIMMCIENKTRKRRRKTLKYKKEHQKLQLDGFFVKR